MAYARLRAATASAQRFGRVLVCPGPWIVSTTSSVGTG
jgi:hypothetical protein